MGNCVSETTRENHKKTLSHLSNLEPRLTNLSITKPPQPLTQPKPTIFLNSLQDIVFQQITNSFNNHAPFTQTTASYTSEFPTLFQTNKSSVLKCTKFNDQFPWYTHNNKSAFNTESYLLWLDKEHKHSLDHIYEYETSSLGTHLNLGTLKILEVVLLFSEKQDPIILNVYKVKIPDKNVKSRSKWVVVLKLIFREGKFLYAVTTSWGNSIFSSYEECVMIIDSYKTEKLNCSNPKKENKKYKSGMLSVESIDDIFCFDVYEDAGQWKRGFLVKFPFIKVFLFEANCFNAMIYMKI
jgi:hypothetical protein